MYLLFIAFLYRTLDAEEDSFKDELLQFLKGEAKKVLLPPKTLFLTNLTNNVKNCMLF